MENTQPPLRVLFVAAEARPLVQVGGLADVAGDLPRFLAALGHDVRLVIPHYAVIDSSGLSLSPLRDALSVPMMGRRLKASLHTTLLGNKLPTYLIGSKRYFAGPSIYGGADEVERFFFFCRALFVALKELKWQPDIFHCHDWHTAAAVCLLKTTYQNDSLFSSCASVFTIHNLGYQGWFDPIFANASGLAKIIPAVDPSMRDKFNTMMALGIYYSDIITTVSQTYSREILTPEYGKGLDPVLKMRQKDLYGVINGIDYDEFNPATDPLIPQRYDRSNLAKRAQNKIALQIRANLPTGLDIPLIGMVGRLAEQKGIDILAQAMAPFLDKEKAQLVLLGSGEEPYRQMATGIAEKHPDKAVVLQGFDPALARLIYSGSDLFLMPSRYEPCGLGQLIALRYGSIPVVRKTGGLAETVEDASPNLEKGHGFVFEEYSPIALTNALQRALAAWRKGKAWRQMTLRAMSLDFSWGPSARSYEELYYKALASRQKAKRQSLKTGIREEKAAKHA